MGAIALMGSVGFSACSDQIKEMEKATPTDNTSSTSVVSKATELVPVNLGLSFSTTNGPATTRMTAANTQASTTETFRGINQAKIFSFALDNIGDWVVGNSKAPNQVLTFNGTVISRGGASTSSAPRVLEVTLPAETNALMFYGKAIRSASPSNEDNTLEEEQGKIDYALNDDPFSSTFSYVPRLDAREVTNFTNAQHFLSGILTGIIAAGLQVEPNPAHVTDPSAPETIDRRYWFWFCESAPVITSGTTVTNHRIKELAEGDESNYRATFYDGSVATTPADKPTTKVIEVNGTDYTYTLYCIDKAWHDYGKAVENPTEKAKLDVLEVNLGQAYSALTTIQGPNQEEFRAGSAEAVFRTVHDLEMVCTKIKNAIPTNVKEAVAKEMASRISNERIRTYFQFATDGSISLKSGAEFSTIRKTIQDYNNANYEEGSTNRWDLSNLSYEHVTGFPDIFHVPVGGTLLTYTKSGTEGQSNYDATAGVFSYRENLPDYDAGNSGSLTVNNYVYPAELVYFGNSPVKVTDESNVTWPSADKWLSAETTYWPTTWKSGANGLVTSSTRNVAMAQHINYGTALLKTSVYFGAATIQDNSTPAKNIEVQDGSFKLKGVIVAQQPEKVGWDFLPTSTTGNTNTRLVYDNSMNSTIITSDKNATCSNYTLLFDNYRVTNGTTVTQQQPVYVLLELINNTGMDIRGYYNMIRNGGTFYLIGLLDPQGRDLTERSDGYALPPYTNGTTINWKPRVFMQDYMTSATFKIDANSLKKAYVTMPDLQAEQVSLGLSVDVQWETGLSFDDIVVGGSGN